MLNDYGMAPSTTFFLALENGIIPKNSDVYNASASNNGNTQWISTAANGDKTTYTWDLRTTTDMKDPKYYTETNRGEKLDWNGFKHKTVDFRLFYV